MGLGFDALEYRVSHAMHAGMNLADWNDWRICAESVFCAAAIKEKNRTAENAESNFFNVTTPGGTV